MTKFIYKYQCIMAITGMTNWYDADTNTNTTNLLWH
jgi:hypothetical protein